MKALVLGEESGTVGEKGLPALDYYRGNFLPVARLIDDVDEYADTKSFVFSETHGLLEGTDKVPHSPPEISEDQIFDEASNRFLSESSIADVVIVLLTTDVFRRLIGENWERIVTNAQPNSVWCLGTGRSALQESDLDMLENAVDALFVYERVGVAPIDGDTRERLLEYVSG